MKKLLILIISLGIIGCSGNNTTIWLSGYDGNPETENYIQEFVFPDTIMLLKNTETSFIMFIYGETFEYREHTKEIWERYSDTNYNKPMVRFSNKAIAVDNATIDIWCDSDFNSNFPAGTSLGDIITAYVASPVKFIESGYKDEYDWQEDALKIRNRYAFIDYGFLPVFGRLSALKPKDFKIIYPAVYLWFDESPPAGEMEFTAVFATEDKRLETKAVINFSDNND